MNSQIIDNGIAVAGAAGRMGQRIIAFVSDNSKLRLGAAYEFSSHPKVGEDSGLTAGISSNGIAISDSSLAALGCKVLIDFTTPDSTEKNVAFCVENGINLVVGSTGLSEKIKEDIKKASQKIAVVFAPNMGVGINVLLSVVRDIAKRLGDDYDIEIIEAHHNKKKDSPSGTALGLAEAVAEGIGVSLSEAVVNGRHGLVGARPKREIGIHAVRGGDIIGEHTVLFAGPGEKIEISHSVVTRDVFAKGAVKAAEFLLDKRNGLYDMQDVLKLR